jgi:UDP-N-acetylmuramoyl-L-alanine---L-glutamate ligase
VRLADLRGRSVAVWGTGREGRAAITAISAVQPSQLVVVNDNEVEWDGPLFFGESALPALLAADVVVRSPGVPQTHPWMASLREKGVTVTGGSALWMADNARNTVGVTGSKGKSTTSALISHLLTAIGRPNVFGGNIGVPLLDLPPAEQYVLELSSYQCSDLTDSPRVAVVTSLFPEHLDSHGGEREYYRDKLNLLAHGPELIVINGADDRLVRETLAARDANGFAAVPAAGGDSRFRVEDDGLVYCSDEPLFPRAALKLRGEHNGRNLCVALAVLDGMGIDVVGSKEELREAAESFQGLPHRLAEIADPSGLIFVDDTLSTSPHATIQAIDAYAEKPLTVLVGGNDRGVDYGVLREHLRGKTLTVIGLPDSGPRILAELEGLDGVRLESAGDLREAVVTAREVTPAGGAVLLSPGAPSYGRFRNFEHRSEAFLAAIRETA